MIGVALPQRSGALHAMRPLEDVLGVGFSQQSASSDVSHQTHDSESENSSHDESMSDNTQHDDDMSVDKRKKLKQSHDRVFDIQEGIGQTTLKADHLNLLPQAVDSTNGSNGNHQQDVDLASMQD